VSAREPAGAPGRALQAEEAADTSPARQRFLAIHRTVRERIALLEYPPGTRLDVERLADEFDVSRTPIRSVLQRLEHQGLVATRHGVGTSVTEIGLEHLREAIELRMRLAELIGELSPATPGPESIRKAELAAEHGRALQQTGSVDPQGFGRVDIAVHESVCELIGNAQLLQVYDELFYRTVRMWFVLLPRLDWGREVEILCGDIDQIRRAVRRADARGVGFIMRNALSAALYRLLDHLGDSEGAECSG